MATKSAGAQSAQKRRRFWNRLGTPSYFEALEPRQLMSADLCGDTSDQAYIINAALTSTPTVIADSLSNTDCKDFIKFTLNSSQLFTASLSGLSANANLRLYSKTGELIGASLAAGTANENIQVELSADDYYVLVSRELGDTNYSLSLSASNVVADAAGNTKAKAKDLGSIADGGSFDTSDFVGVSDTTDFYKFTITSLSTVALSLKNLQSDADLQLIDSNGAVIMTSSHSGTTTETMTPSLRAGTYYLRVYRYSGDTTYQLTGAVTAIPDIAGNTTSTALDMGKLAPTATVVKDMLDAYDTDDFFTFSVGSYSQVTVVLKDLSADATLKLMDNAGNVIDTSSISGNAEERLYLKLNKGYYFLRVSLNSGSTTYSLRALADPLTGQSDANQQDGTVTAVTSGNYDVLQIFGTASADTIIVTQSGNTLNISINGNEHSVNVQNVSEIALWGGDGDDTITITTSVTLDARVYGQGGNDKIKNQTTGYGTIVSIGGGVDTISGGLDTSFWFDNGDIAYTTQADLSAGRVHKITAFYQPYATTSTSDPNYISTELNGQDLPDPYAVTEGNSVTTTTNISSYSLWGTGPQLDDINQNQLGDCYYLATIGSMAYATPDKLRERAVDLGDGTYAVFYSRGGVNTYVRVDGDVVGTSVDNLRFTYPQDGGSIWACIMEKAYAYFRTGANTYASIEGGWTYAVLNDFGVVNNNIDPSGSVTQANIYQYVITALASDKPVMFSTVSDMPDGIPLIGSHAYSVVSAYVNSQGQYAYVVRNPWGIDGIENDSYKYDGYVTITGAQLKAGCDGVNWAA